MTSHDRTGDWSLEAVLAGVVGAWIALVGGLLVVAVVFFGDSEPQVLAQRQIRVALSDFEITPDVIQVAPATDLTLLVENVPGGAQHDLTVSADITTGRIKPGESALLSVGEVSQNTVIWCAVKGHRELGMEAFIEVAQPAS